jgi:hypothetical protein
MASAPITNCFYWVKREFTDAGGHTWPAGLMVALDGRPEEAPFERMVSAGTGEVTTVRVVENG